MKIANIVLTVILLACLAACGSNGQSNDFAPATLTGQSYRLTINASSGLPFASTGTAIIAFAETTYTITGDGVNIIDSDGTYTYRKTTGTIGEAVILDSVFTQATYRGVWMTASSGDFAIISSTIDGRQDGTFTSID
jgi:hypothetical protein